MSTVSALSGPVTRTWRVGPRGVCISLMHNTIIGSRAVTVDGSEVGGSAGQFTVFSKDMRISFSASGVTGYVTLASTGTQVCAGLPHN